MIPRRFIEEWKEHALWPENAQIEQDLVIEKSLIQLFSSSLIQEKLSFRGGTALHKLFLKPQVRYSEDIDLVQINSEPIKEIISEIRKQLMFLGKPSIKQKRNNNTVVFRFESEVPPIINLRLKIEINCREHFTVLGYKEHEYHVENGWFRGDCLIKTFCIEELLGSKLRALYQRRKGRDLFDLYYALNKLNIDTELTIQCYKEYMFHSVSNPPTQRQFIQNMNLKLEDSEFLGDIFALLRPEVEYDPNKAYDIVKSELIEKI